MLDESKEVVDDVSQTDQQRRERRDERVERSKESAYRITLAALLIYNRLSGCQIRTQSKSADDVVQRTADLLEKLCNKCGKGIASLATREGSSTQAIDLRGSGLDKRGDGLDIGPV